MFKIFNIIKNVKNKYLDILIVILLFIFFFIIYKSNNIIKKNICTSRNSITNNYLETKGDNVLLNNLNLLEIKENNISNNTENISSYIIKNRSNELLYDFSNPLVKKISSIIIGRYNLGEIKNKIIIKTVYYNVNDIINKKLKLRDDILNDTYKLNEVIEKVTLIVSRILFKIINEPLTKILIGQYIIKKTDNNREINEIYEYLINISNNTILSIDIRMNAIDILNLSNNNKYTEISKKILQSIRRIEQNTTGSNTFNDNLNRVINNIKNVNNSNNRVNVPIQNLTQLLIQPQQIHHPQRPQLLVERDGTTYPIPPDINVPPLRQINIETIKPKISIYDDGQNVHNTTINETTLKTASELIKKYNPKNRVLNFTYYKTKNFNELQLKNIEKIDKAIHRINTDTSTFGKGFNLYTVYQSLLNLIEQHNQKRDLEERLIDELIDMSEKCSTGHLSRLINVLQGFETDLEVKVKININDEVYAKIKHLIEKEIMNQENMDELMEDMLSENKTIYIKFVKDTINKNIDEIVKEYENVDVKDIRLYNNENENETINEIVIDMIIKLLDKYTGTKDEFIYLLKNKNILYNIK
jgi:hypothetical protein